MNMKYTSKENVYLAVAGHPEGIMLPSLTRELFPEVSGSQYASAKKWVSKVLSELRRKGRLYNTGEDGLPFLRKWFAVKEGSDETQS